MASRQEQVRAPSISSGFGKVFTRYLREPEKGQLELPEEKALEVVEEPKGQLFLSPNWLPLTFGGVLPAREGTMMPEDNAAALTTESVPTARDLSLLCRNQQELQGDLSKRGADPPEQVRPTEKIPLQGVPKGGEVESMAKPLQVEVEGTLQTREPSVPNQAVPHAKGFLEKADHSIAPQGPWAATPKTVSSLDSVPAMKLEGTSNHEPEQFGQTEMQRTPVPEVAATLVNKDVESDWSQTAQKEPGPVLQENVEGSFTQDTNTTLKLGITGVDPVQQGDARQVLNDPLVPTGQLAETRALPTTSVQPGAMDPIIPATSWHDTSAERSVKAVLAEVTTERVTKGQRKGLTENNMPQRPIQAKGEELGPVEFRVHEPQVARADVEPQIRTVLDLQDRSQLIPRLVQKMESLVQGERSEVRIQLKPDHLGEMKIKLSLERGIMVAEFMVQSEAVGEVIASQLPQLQTALQNHGSNIADVSVSIGLSHKGPDDQGRPGSKQPGHNGSGRLQKGTVSRQGQAYLGRSIWNQVDVRV